MSSKQHEGNTNKGRTGLAASCYGLSPLTQHQLHGDTVPMKKGIYVIYDKLAKDVMGVLQLHNSAVVATRQFRDIMNLNREDNPFLRNPEDYQLECIGILDLETLEVIPHHEVICTAEALIASAQEVKEHA